MRIWCFPFQHFNTQTQEGKAWGRGVVREQTTSPTNTPSFQTEIQSLLGLEGSRGKWGSPKINIWWRCLKEWEKY